MAMNKTEQIEQCIREVLATETDAIALSRRLFSPGGLFPALGTTEAERRVISQSPLFKEAQRRLSELQRQEAAAFARVVEQVKAARSGEDVHVKLEGVEMP